MLRAFSSLAALVAAFSFSAWAQDTSAKLISAPDFTISDKDKADGITGTMRVMVIIDEKGEVKNAVTVVGPLWPCSGHLDGRVNSIMRDVESAALKFRFSPAIKAGKPVDSRVTLAITLGPTLWARAPWSPPAIERNDQPDPETDDAGTVKSVKGGVLNGKAISLPKPHYPREAASAKVGGAVAVKVFIDEKGKVISAQAVTGHPLLHSEARAAACAAKFSPTLLSGSPVTVSGIITYNFVP